MYPRLRPVTCSIKGSHAHLCIGFTHTSLLLLPAHKHQTCFSYQYAAAPAAADQSRAVQEELQYTLAGKQAQCTIIADLEGSLAGLQQQLTSKQEHNATLENVSQTYSLRVAELEDSEVNLHQQLDFLKQKIVDKVSHCAGASMVCTLWLFVCKGYNAARSNCLGCLQSVWTTIVAAY